MASTCFDMFKTTKQNEVSRVGRSSSVIGNALSEALLLSVDKIMKDGQFMYIGHNAYALLHGEDAKEVIIEGKYQKNSPKVRELRGVNKHFKWDGKTTGMTAVSVIITGEGTAKELGLQVGDYAFQIMRVSS